MATKRKPIYNPSAKLNYRPSNEKTEIKGTKPTISQTSVWEIITLMILHICKKCLHSHKNNKIYVYLAILFVIGLLSDVGTPPKVFLSRSDNILNQYFVKYAWGWNLIMLTPYVILTSYIYCCGEKDKMMKNHILRIIIATFFWWLWTNTFNLIESSFGNCIKSGQFNSKSACLKAGNIWTGLDISGHAFILIYGCLLLMEETTSMVNWDTIKDHLRLEEHYRNTNNNEYNTNPLKSLSHDQFALLQTNYEKYTPYIRMFFVGITVLYILWHIMLLSTVLYFHVMIEKFLGGIVAILTWFITYRMWFPSKYLPRLPGDGMFKYMKSKTSTSVPILRRRTGSIVNETQPTFMGRPLYTGRSESTNGEEAAR